MAVVVTVNRRRRIKDFYSQAVTGTPYSGTPSEPGSDVGRIEKGRITGLSSHTVNISFDAFQNLPIVSHLKVYKYVEIIAGNWQQQEVLYKFNSATPLTTTGLIFEIDSSESLTNVIVEYVIL